MKLSPKKAAIAVLGLPQLGRKKLPRGRPFVKGNTVGTFPKGQSGNPGGKPRVHLRFAAKIAETMLQPVPPEVKKALRLKRGATIYDAMIAALLMNAMGGDNSAFMNVHDIVDGPIIQKRFNLTAAAERFFDDPKFREFLEEQHGTYLNQIGVTTNGTEQRPRVAVGSPLHRLLGTEGTEGS